MQKKLAQYVQNIKKLCVRLFFFLKISYNLFKYEVCMLKKHDFLQPTVSTKPKSEICKTQLNIILQLL